MKMCVMLGKNASKMRRSNKGIRGVHQVLQAQSSLPAHHRGEHEIHYTCGVFDDFQLLRSSVNRFL